MLDNPEWLLVVLAVVAVLACLGLGCLLFLAACVWKPEHVYGFLLSVRRLVVGTPVGSGKTQSAWTSE